MSFQSTNEHIAGKYHNAKSYLKIFCESADEDGTLSKEDFLEILNLVENYVFRRAICGIPTNSLNKTFGNLYKFIKESRKKRGRFC